MNQEPYKNNEFRRFPIVINFDSFIVEHVAMHCCLREFLGSNRVLFGEPSYGSSELIVGLSRIVHAAYFDH